jgi:DNA-directed RNA polymerase subunit alpha
VIEDVTDIILNVKGILVRTDRTDGFNAVIDVEGTPGQTRVVTAGDMRFDGAAEVLNPDHAIATITGAGRLHMEMRIAMGKGYVPADRNKNDETPIGTIPIDAIHSPIRRVKYTVTNARVGQRTDFDKLTLEVWTNGSVSPEDSVAFAAKIMKEQLQIFINFMEVDEPSAGEERAQTETFNESLFKRVDELDLSVRSANCLQNAGIEFIWQLVEKTEAEMLKTKNFGRKSLNEIKEILSELGLSLGMKLHNFPKSRGEPRLSSEEHMRHLKAGRKLSIYSAHRNAMFGNMVTSLMQHGRVRTTEAKAKEVRRVADKLITLAKRVTPSKLAGLEGEELRKAQADRVHAIRLARRWITDRDVLTRLFTEYSTLYENRPGGYTRILKVGRRPGDQAAMNLLELVTEAYPSAGAESSEAQPSV